LLKNLPELTIKSEKISTFVKRVIDEVVHSIAYHKLTENQSFLKEEETSLRQELDNSIRKILSSQ
jgi:hypothetical protein